MISSFATHKEVRSHEAFLIVYCNQWWVSRVVTDIRTIASPSYTLVYLTIAVSFVHWELAMKRRGDQHWMSPELLNNVLSATDPHNVHTHLVLIYSLNHSYSHPHSHISVKPSARVVGKKSDSKGMFKPYIKFLWLFNYVRCNNSVISSKDTLIIYLYLIILHT